MTQPFRISLVPCIESFRVLALTNPNDLMNWIMSGDLEESTLTYALEELGRADDSTAVDLLLEYSTHSSRIVREGAVCGMAHRGVTHPRVQLRLKEMHETDPSPGVRATAGDFLVRCLRGKRE